MITLTRTFTFESAHRLAKGYEGKCANIHGHSWVGSLTVSAQKLDSMGMGIDYAHLDAFNDAIVDRFDHTLMLYEDDQPLRAFCDQQRLAVVTFSDNPTSEVVAKTIFDDAVAHFSSRFPDITIESVTIEETCRSRCVWTG